MHAVNSFITLSYGEEFLPLNGSLDYAVFQAFMKRLRQRAWRNDSSNRIRFYMCGEYGELRQRPHYHSCLFGFDFYDKLYLGKSPAGSKLYRSAMLEELWPYGFSSVGEVTFESAAYVARYCMKKITGPRADEHYSVVNIDTGEISVRTPEFNHMSLKPGIGGPWIKKFMSDVYPHGKVVVRGRECPPPRFYDKKFEELDGLAYEGLQYGRHLETVARSSDNTWTRLLDKETVTKARLKTLVRKL